VTESGVFRRFAVVYYRSIKINREAIKVFGGSSNPHLHAYDVLSSPGGGGLGNTYTTHKRSPAKRLKFFGVQATPTCTPTTCFPPSEGEALAIPTQPINDLPRSG